MLSIAESDDEASIMLVSDKPKAIIPLSDARAEALHAQLGLMIRTRKARRGEPVKPEPSLDEPEADAEVAEPLRPGPIPATRRQPFIDTVGREDAQSLIGAAEARDAAEVARRRQKASPPDPGETRLAKRRARLATIKVPAGVESGEDDIQGIEGADA